jgi:hypothetical protein
MPPPLPLFAALRDKPLLALCYRAVARCGEKAAALNLKRAKAKKNNILLFVLKSC